MAIISLLSTARSLERLAGSLRIWAGGKAGEKVVWTRKSRDYGRAMLGYQKRIVGMEDAGYESMSEEGEGC